MTRRYSVTVAGQTRAVEIEDVGTAESAVVRAVVDGRAHALDLRVLGPGRFSWLQDDTVVAVSVQGAAPSLSVALPGWRLPVEVTDARALAAAAVTRVAVKTGPLIVRSPISGRLVRLLVKAGDVVAAGGGLAIVEAMKMENEIRAPRAGTVGAICCGEGSSVEAGQELAILG